MGCYGLSRVKNFVPLQSRILIYNSLFKSHLEYGSIIWPTCSNKDFNKIVCLQKRIVRHINKSHFTSHTEPILSKHKILMISDLIQLRRIIFMQKLVRNSLPAGLIDIFKKLSTFN